LILLCNFVEDILFKTGFKLFKYYDSPIDKKIPQN
jgi:hypothetical protein